MKIFLAYRFIGEDIGELSDNLEKIRAGLEGAGHQVLCPFWRHDFFVQQNYDRRQIMEYSHEEIDRADLFLAFIKSSARSEGMLLEAGYALAKNKPVITAVKKDAETTFLRDLADRVIEFDDLENLLGQLKELSC